MNSEESRLQTFRNWPVHAPVDARRIAQAGFFYLNQELEVKCFSCGGVISEWNYGDKVMTRHRVMNPACPFVLNPSLSGNIPTTNNESTLSQSSNNNHVGVSPNTPEETSQVRTSFFNYTTSDPTPSTYLSEAVRLESFTNWPIPFIVTPARLAKAGFYYVQQGDKVKCAYCGGVVGRWEAGDDPEVEHRRHYPSCSFFLNRTTGDLNFENPSGINFRGSDDTDSTMRSLGIQSHKMARHPKYISTEARLDTYNTWPGDVTRTPEELAEAGFYYAGSGDQVRCFHCDGGLKCWEPSDDPWLEHARWFPECGFVLLVKGQKFIDEAIKHLPPIVPEEEVANVHTTITTDVATNNNLGPPVRQRRVTEEELTALMSTAEAVAALQIGVDHSRVKMALRQKIEHTGVAFSSADDLIVAALEIQMDEPPSLDSDDVWATPPNSPLLRTSNRRRNYRASQPRPIRRRVVSDSSETSDSDSSGHHSESPKPPVTTHKPVQKNTSESKIDSTANQNSDVKITLEEENRRLKEARLCKICMDNEVCVVFLPCGHLVTCINCAHSLADCPVCRKLIKATVRTFLS